MDGHLLVEYETGRFELWISFVGDVAAVAGKPPQGKGITISQRSGSMTESFTYRPSMGGQTRISWTYYSPLPMAGPEKGHN